MRPSVVSRGSSTAAASCSLLLAARLPLSHRYEENVDLDSTEVGWLGWTCWVAPVVGASLARWLRHVGMLPRIVLVMLLLAPLKLHTFFSLPVTTTPPTMLARLPAAAPQVATIDTAIPASNVGYKLLQRMGWRPGGGLGREQQGAL